MATFTDYTKKLTVKPVNAGGLRVGGTTVSGSTRGASGNYRFVTPQGQGTNSMYGPGPEMTRDANYMNPASLPAYQQYLQPITSGSVMGTSTGTSGSASDPEEAQKTTLKSQIGDKLKSLQNVFTGLFGVIDNTVKEKADTLSKDYNQQYGDLQRSFEGNIGQTNQIYGARGLGDSSYRGLALDQASDIYNRSLADTARNQEGQLAQLGQYASNAKRQAQSSLDAYNQYAQNLDQYSASDLNTLLGNFTQGLGDAQNQAANLGTNSQFIGELNKIAPVQQQGTAQLAQKLQTLVTSSAPAFAKKQIAQGLVKQAGLSGTEAQNYWTGYFEDLLRQSGQA